MPERFEYFKPKKKLPVRKKGPSFSQRYGPDWEAIRLQVLVRDNWQCRHCGRVCGDRWEAQVDHIVPLRQSENHLQENLQVLCIRCHLRKTQQGL